MRLCEGKMMGWCYSRYKISLFPFMSGDVSLARVYNYISYVSKGEIAEIKAVVLLTIAKRGLAVFLFQQPLVCCTLAGRFLTDDKKTLIEKVHTT